MKKRLRSKKNSDKDVITDCTGIFFRNFSYFVYNIESLGVVGRVNL